jgi:carbonic anhydrase
MFGITQVMVVHHTDCGMTHFTEDGIHAKLHPLFPRDQEAVDQLVFGTIADHDQAVREDIAFLKANRFIRNEIDVRGFVYELESGLIREVAEQ